MELTIKFDSTEVKDAVTKEANLRYGTSFSPADLNLYIKFDDVSKSVVSATLTKKD